MGLYGFRLPTLLQLVELLPTPLEKAEQLEQLRWLEHGFPIKVGLTDHESAAIDTTEDLKKFRQKYLHRLGEFL